MDVRGRHDHHGYARRSDRGDRSTEAARNCWLNDMDMRATDTIRLAFVEEELERVFAVRRAVEEDLNRRDRQERRPGSLAVSGNPAQPQALAEDFVLTGDSIETAVLCQKAS